MPVAQRGSPMQRTVCIPGEGRVKLRSSCDACSIAKVKCDSQAPCERCQNNAISCFYSPSRRHGKQSWARRVAEQHQRYMQSTMHSHTSQASAGMEKYVPMHPHPEAPSTLAMPSTISPVAPTSPLMNFPLVPNPAGSPSVEHPFHVGNNLQFRNPWPGSTMNVAPALSSSSTSMSPLLEPAFQPALHDCEAKALTLFHSLHMTPLEPLTSGSPGSQQHPPLDKILHANRVAVSTLGDLVQCRCAEQPHLALLYMAIISKSLSWYRLAANLSFKPFTQHCETHSESSSPQSQTLPYSMSPVSYTSTAAPYVAPNQTTEAPKANTIQIGMYDLEEGEEAILVRSVVMTEIKKAGRLVEFLKNDSVNGEGYKQEDLSIGSWYKVGGEKLEKEVQETMQEARGSVRISSTSDKLAGWGGQK